MLLAAKAASAAMSRARRGRRAVAVITGTTVRTMTAAYPAMSRPVRDSLTWNSSRICGSRPAGNSSVTTETNPTAARASSGPHGSRADPCPVSAGETNVEDLGKAASLREAVGPGHAAARTPDGARLAARQPVVVDRQTRAALPDVTASWKTVRRQPVPLLPAWAKRCRLLAARATRTWCRG